MTDDLLNPKTQPPSDESLEQADKLRADASNPSDADLPANSRVPKLPPSPRPTKSQSAPQKSRRELYEEARKRKGHIQRSGDDAKIIKPSFEQPPVKRTKPQSTAEEATDPFKPGEIPEFPDLSFGLLAASTLQMLASPGLRWRAGIAALLIGIGSAVMHPINNAWSELTKQGPATMTDWLSSLGSWLLFGGVPYVVGSGLCWLVCSYVFRDAAQGFRSVKKFHSGATSELSSTFLLFSFSFAIAGLPVALFPILMTPFRFLVAPPLLLAAWYNKSPFGIVAVDAFETTLAERGQWKVFYSYDICLVVFAVIGGLLMSVPTMILSAFCSLLGAAILVLTTIAFAAAIGWHCGRIVQRLENNA